MVKSLSGKFLTKIFFTYTLLTDKKPDLEGVVARHDRLIDINVNMISTNKSVQGCIAPPLVTEKTVKSKKISLIKFRIVPG